MKNDSDFYSGHKTLLKISIYQFNKTSSGARPFSFGSPYHDPSPKPPHRKQVIIPCIFYVITRVVGGS